MIMVLQTTLVLYMVLFVKWGVTLQGVMEHDNNVVKFHESPVQHFPFTKASLLSSLGLEASGIFSE